MGLVRRMNSNDEEDLSEENFDGWNENRPKQKLSLSRKLKLIDKADPPLDKEKIKELVSRKS